MPTTHPSDRIHFISARFYKDSTTFCKDSERIPKGFARIPEDSMKNSHDFLIFVKFHNILQRFWKDSERIPKGYARIPEDSARDSHDSLKANTKILQDSMEFLKMIKDSSISQKSQKDGFQLTSLKTPKTQQSAYYFVANYIFQRILSLRHTI